MTTYDAQVHCSGVQQVLDYESSFKKSLDSRYCKKIFPVNTDSGLGFDFAYFSYDTRLIEGNREVTGRTQDRVAMLKNYVEQKQIHLLTLERYLNQECLISPNGDLYLQPISCVD